ncbi:MAG: TonB-dependent receptor [Pseudomonadota bacterium]
MRRTRSLGLRCLLHMVLGGLCAGAASAAVTETDFLDELPVVLSASRLSQPSNEAPAAVTIIDQDMIRASGFRDIPDLLRLVPGFSIAYTRDNTWAVGYHGLADAFSRRFQVLVDGRSIYSPAFGAVQWQELPLSIDDIERIEVVRGPNAATFGSNAFLAVINIVTKEAVQVSGSFASLQYGEQGMAGLTARYGGQAGDLNYRLTFSAQDRDRFETDAFYNVSMDPIRLFEETRTYMLNGRADYRVSAKDELSAQFGLTAGDWQAGRLADPPDPEHELEPRQQDVRNAYLQFRFRRVHNVDNEWSMQFYHSRHDIDAPSHLDIFGLTVLGDQDTLQTRTSLEFQANTQLSPTLRMAWGAEVRHESAESPLYFDTSASQDGVLGRVNANLEWRAHPDWLLQGGAMLEHHYYSGFDVSPRVAVNFSPVPDHTLRLSVSQAYRTPTFFEQDGAYVYRSTGGLPVDVIFVPSSLDPERMRSHEIGYVGQYRPLKLRVDAKLFYDRVDDYIGNTELALPVGAELVSGGGPGEARHHINRGSVDFRGAELQLEWRPAPAIRLLAQYAHVALDSGDDILDEDVEESAPRNSYSLLASYGLGRGWAASVGIYHSDAMIWLGDGDTTPAFTRIDARLSRNWTWRGYRMEAALVGQNLGEDYAEFRDTNVFSRRVYGSLSFAW